MNSKILDIDTQVQHFAIISDTSILSTLFIERLLMFVIFSWNAFLTFFIDGGIKVFNISVVKLELIEC